MIRAVLFDCDGVLVDSEPAHFEAFRVTLDEEGIRLSFDSYLRDYLAFDDEELFRLVFEAEGRPLPDGLLVRLLARKGRLLAERLAVLPVIESSLLFARAALAEGCAVAVVSGARRDEVLSVIERGGMTSEIPVVVTTEDVRRGKPDPEPYLTALDRLNGRSAADLAPADCLVVEDSIVGLHAGRAAGMRVVGLTTSYSPAELGEADLVLSDLTDLTPRLVEELL